MAPNSPARLAVARKYFEQNQLPAAEAELQAILAEQSEDVQAKLLLAVILARTGRLTQADGLLTSTYQKVPKNTDVIGLLGAIRKTLGDLPGAIELFQRLAELGRGTADTYNHIGLCRLEMGDAVAAGIAFKRAIELDRSQARSYYNLGLALQMAGNSFETFSTFRRSIDLDPSFHDGYVQLWNQMRKLLNWQEGLPILEQGLRQHPNSTQLKVLAATTYGKLGMVERAEQLFKAAVAVEPALGPTYAHWMQEEGRFEDSIPILAEAIRANPIQGQAYYNLAVAKRFEVDGKSLTELVPPLLENKTVDTEERMFLHYALAKAFDQERDYERAMRSYDSANEHAFRLYNANLEGHSTTDEMDERTLARLYDKQDVERLRGFGSRSPMPIFIVGMIRTGTTLLDQILSSHRDVKSAGEQPFWQVSAGRANRRWVETGLNASDMAELENRYLEVLRQAARDASRVVDKMPTNFSHMGLMSVVFPRAKFIHIRRHPIDTCLSIYTTFLGSGTEFAYSQRNIVDYYRKYLHTMEFWRTVVPSDQLIEIDYEELVTDKERVLRGVLEFCGLDWDESCLYHERNLSQVSTPSLWTARQPVNTASVERWRRYEPWLGKLLELKDVKHPPRVGP